MAIYSEFSHEKRWCSIVMLVYQRVNCGNIGCVTHAHISMICHGYILENVATMVWRQILVPKNWIWSFIPCQIDQEKTNILVISGYDRVLCACQFVRSFFCVHPCRKGESIHHVFDGFRQQLDLVSFSFRSKSHRRKNLNVQSPGDVSQEVDKNSLCPSLFF